MTTRSALSNRYLRALQLAGPKFAGRSPEVLVDGYWLDATHFYFSTERFDVSLGQVVGIPAIADTEARTVEDVLPFEVLNELLARQLSDIDAQALSVAELGMVNRNTLAVSVSGKHFLIDVAHRQVVSMCAASESPALYSPNGRYACFIKGADCWLREQSTGMERPLSTDGSLHNSYGQQPEAALQPESSRRHPVPMGLWSRDSRWFLTHRIDERTCPKYPLPGDPLPIASYVVFDVEAASRVIFADVPAVAVYSPFQMRLAWFCGDAEAVFLRFDRYCRKVDLVLLDLEHGTSRIVLSESVQAGYIDLHPIVLGTPNVRVLARTEEVIWFSERDGYGHLYLYDRVTGALKNRITRGAWQVRDIVHVDEEGRRLLFLAAGLDAGVDRARRVLCTINFDGSGFEVLLRHDGDISIAKTEPGGVRQDRPFRCEDAQPGISPGGRFGVVRHLSVDGGDRVEIRPLERCTGGGLALGPQHRAEGNPHRFTGIAADGVTSLYGVLFLPSDFTPQRRYPLIDYIYPGPHIAQQPQSSQSVNAALARALAELGFVTLMLDTRGTPVGNRTFHQCGYGALLEPQLADHAAVVRQLCERFGYLDANRIGIFGQSAGGAATVRALSDYSDTFAVGVAVCAYDDPAKCPASWGDKYLGPGGRESWSEPATRLGVQRLRGKLLLIAGGMDERVHVSHTFAIVEALLRANKDFELLVVPDAGHMVLMEKGAVQKTVWDYFVRHLLGEPAAHDVELVFDSRELSRFERRSIQELGQ